MALFAAMIKLKNAGLCHGFLNVFYNLHMQSISWHSLGISSHIVQHYHDDSAVLA